MLLLLDISTTCETTSSFSNPPKIDEGGFQKTDIMLSFNAILDAEYFLQVSVSTS